MEKQYKAEYLILAFFAISTTALWAMHSYAIYTVSVQYLSVAPMLAVFFAPIAGGINDAGIWICHSPVIDLDEKIKKLIIAVSLGMSMGTGVLFSFLIVGQSDYWFWAVAFYSLFQIAAIILQFITSGPSLSFIFGKHKNPELKRLDDLRTLSNELADRFNRADDLDLIGDKIIGEIEMLRAEVSGLSQIVKRKKTTKPKGLAALRKGMSKNEFASWAKSDPLTAEATPNKTLADLVGKSPDTVRLWLNGN